jgi:tetratricopeptide (TPR) repeat protein
MRLPITISFLLTILLFEGNNVFAQDKKAESSYDYKSLKSRSSRGAADLLLNDAERLKLKNPDESLNKVQEALAISLAENDAFNEARCYILIAEINEGILEWKLARANYLQAHDKLSDNKSSPEYLKTLKGLGQADLKLGNYYGAQTYYQELLGMNLDRAEKVEAKINLSEVYYQLGNYDEALKVMEGIPSSTSKKVYDPLAARVDNQRAKIYAQRNELAKTRATYSNSLNTIRAGNAGVKATPKEQESVQDTKEEIADVLQDQGKYDEAIDVRQQAIQFALENDNPGEVAKDKVAISKTLEAKGETSAAIREAEEAARIADTLDNPKDQAHAYLALANIYDRNGRSNQAVTAFKKYSDAVVRAEEQSAASLNDKASLLEKQRDIEEVTKKVSIGQREETIQRAIVFRQQLIIYGLLAIIAIIGVTSYFIYKNAQASKIANQLLALKSLRSQMNPHFIFNALNSVNHFIAQQDERTANRFLSEFALLMRLVLEHSQEDFIPLNKEQEILALYLKLEHYRFRDKFDYEIKVDDSVNAEALLVPPMLIQPYIENAVWHGLRYKEEKGKLLLAFHRHNGELIVEVTDNGIGRKRSAELKTENQKKHNSTGLRNIEERLAIINKVYKVKYRVTIDDLKDDGGTRVNLYLPVNKIVNTL